MDIIVAIIDANAVAAAAAGHAHHAVNGLNKKSGLAKGIVAKAFLS